MFFLKDRSFNNATQSLFVVLVGAEIVGAFGKLRKAAISFMSVRPAPTGRIFMTSDIWGFKKNLSRTSSFIKI
jgi:hypothetical protein